MSAANGPSAIPTPATPDVCTVKILMEGTEISGAYHILSVLVAKEINRIPAATLHIQDGEASKATFEVSNTDLFIPGKKIEIKLGYRSQEETVFKGIVVKHSLKLRKNSNLLIVECRDEAVKMTLTPINHYFTNQKDSDIAEEIIGKYGLQKDVKPTTRPIKEIFQYDTTDWDFLMCRAEANGQVVRVEDGKIFIAAPDVKQDPVLNVQYGATLLEMDMEMDARFQNALLKTTAWNPATQKTIEAEAGKPATTATGNLTPSALANSIGMPTHILRHGGAVSQTELQAWADERQLKNHLAKVRGRVKFQGFAEIKPGNLLEIGGIGERFEGKLFVSGVRHQVAAGNWETDVQLGLSPEPFAKTADIHPLPAAGLVAPVAGLQTGIVTQLEGDPEKQNRIKVRLSLTDAQAKGTWARIATLDAGKERGTFFRPDIGDEVIIGFINDDPNHAVMLGMCHSSNKPAPEPLKNTNHQKGYWSRSKMKFTFDDEDKIMTLQTPKGNVIKLSEKDKGVTISDQNGNKIIMNNDGITIQSIKDIVLKATKDIKVEGTNLNLKAKGALKAEGSGSAEISSGATTTVKAGATTIIKGGMVLIN
ncbi:type VI secretion system tip protein VgrG [Runella sp.]|uniref:type VI secretion system tip protein VgrG n=1 Tax=Runella sp. TaxID=1960881 RepID=UPI003D0BB653